MVTPVQQAAVNAITQKLDSSGVFNTVTHGEMNEVRAILGNLNAVDADAVIDELARTGRLDTFASEAVDGSWFGNGGYSADERRDLFNDLAGKLDGASLAAVADAFARTDPRGSEGVDRVGELATAIAARAPTSVRVDFIRAQAAATTDGRSVSNTGIGYSSIRDVDAQAAAVATVLGSLSGRSAEAGFRALSPEQLRAVMNSGLDASLDTTGSGMGGATMVASWRTDGLEAVLTAASTIGDADLKARIFDAGVDTMRSVRETNGIIGGLTVVGKADAMTAIRDGLTRIIDSDTSGVVSELNRNTETRNGADLAAYAREMLAGGQEERLGEQLARLQFGNNLNENPVDRLYASTPVAGTPGDRRYQNTEALGYFIGAVDKGATAVTRDITDQREMTTNVLKSLLSVVDKLGGRLAGGAVGITASVAKEWVAMGVRGAIANPTASAADRLEAAALPANPQTGESATGTAIDEAFGAAVQRVIRSDEL